MHRRCPPNAIVISAHSSVRDNLRLGSGRCCVFSQLPIPSRRNRAVSWFEIKKWRGPPAWCNGGTRTRKKTLAPVCDQEGLLRYRRLYHGHMGINGMGSFRGELTHEYSLLGE